MFEQHGESGDALWMDNHPAQCILYLWIAFYQALSQQKINMCSRWKIGASQILKATFSSNGFITFHQKTSNQWKKIIKMDVLTNKIVIFSIFLKRNISFFTL